MRLSARLRATEQQLHPIAALLHERSRWLARRGVDQWATPYPPERLAREIGDGHVWYWLSAGRLVATVALFPQPPDYYPTSLWSDSVAAWYVCRLATAPDMAGRGVGGALLNDVASDAAAEGRQALRLDVNAANDFLRRFYTALGFRAVACGDVMGSLSVFYERQTAERATAR